MRGVICIHGTWGADFDDPTPNQWWEYGSPFCAYLESQGFQTELCDEPYIWSGNAEGVSRLWPWNWFRSPELRTWKAGGRALGYYMRGMHYEDRNVVAHSHGGQVALCAAAHGVKMRRLVTVGTPVRADMRSTVEAARPNIELWLHIVDPNDDDVQVYGGIGDGHLGVERLFAQADRFGAMTGGHSAILNNAAKFDDWRTKGWLTFLRGDDAQKAV